MHRLIGFLAAAICLGVFVNAGADERAERTAKLGHSAHGAAFDEGPRTKPWKMDGIGKSHFPITTSVPEVQDWFDQGNTLLHSFWEFEAERSFRWCLKLDPECAMAYWGLARASESYEDEGQRMRTILKEAVKRKDAVSERERMYIEAWEKVYLPGYANDATSDQVDRDDLEKTLAKELELIALEYPEDDEAKALYVLYSWMSGSTRYGNDAIIRDILERNPAHPGAHHYRVHNWDGKEGAVALTSCEAYGRMAWYSGHANHMPGHIYSGIGMWHEGAIWMDRATRVEKKYMQNRMTLPFHYGNYAHNRNYLSFIQEQLGMPSLSLDGARQLLAAPRDPKYNKPDAPYGVHREGMRALVRGLLKFERWDDVVADGTIPWEDGLEDRMMRAYAETLAHLGLGDVHKAMDRRADLIALKSELEKPDGGMSRMVRSHDRMVMELGGRIALAKGETLDGIRLLGEAAHAQAETYHRENDPPNYPYLLYTVLGEAHLDLGGARLAAECFEKTLDTNPNDAFALSGLARARYALGEMDEAAKAYGRLRFVWSDADEGLRWLDVVAALGLESDPIDESAKDQRNYREQTLDEMGPERWEPYAAPALDALDAEKTRVTLKDYEGRNVLLVFYLGESCVHCVEQLQAIEKRVNDFRTRDVELLAISSATPEQHAASLKLKALPFRLLADPEHENARRFQSYDDFEDMELHSTILIDGAGRVRWARTGGDPFMDLDFLVTEIDRVNRERASEKAVAVAGE